MKVKWLVRSDGQRAPGYVETVDDHLGASFIERGLAEPYDAKAGAKDQKAVKAEALGAPPKNRSIKSPALRGEREE